MNGEFYIVRFVDGGAVQCRGPAPALGYLRRGGCQVVGGDLGALRRLEAEEHGRVEAALDEATWQDVGGAA